MNKELLENKLNKLILNQLPLYEREKVNVKDIRNNFLVETLLGISELINDIDTNIFDRNSFRVYFENDYTTGLCVPYKTLFKEYGDKMICSPYLLHTDTAIFFIESVLQSEIDSSDLIKNFGKLSNTEDFYIIYDTEGFSITTKYVTDNIKFKINLKEINGMRAFNFGNNPALE